MYSSQNPQDCKLRKLCKTAPGAPGARANNVPHRAGSSRYPAEYLEPKPARNPALTAKSCLWLPQIAIVSSELHRVAGRVRRKPACGSSRRTCGLNLDSSIKPEECRRRNCAKKIETDCLFSVVSDDRSGKPWQGWFAAGGFEKIARRPLVGSHPGPYNKRVLD